MHADTLPITGPCPIDLDAIGFDRSARVSHCQHCVKNVHNLSNMTRSEARDWMRENQGKTLCVSYSRTQGGDIAFRPEPVAAPEPALVPLSRLRRPTVARKAGLAAALTVSAALAACTPHGEPPPPPEVTTVVQPSLAQLVAHVVDEPPEVEPPEVFEDGEITVPKPMLEPLAGAAVIRDFPVEDTLIAPKAIAVDEPKEPCDGSKGSDTVGTGPDSVVPTPVHMRGEAPIPRDMR